MSDQTNWNCPACGNPGNTGRFCSHCGTPAPVNPAPVQSPQYNAVPGPAPSAASGGKDPNAFAPEDKKKANRLCIISIILSFVLPVISSLALTFTCLAMYGDVANVMESGLADIYIVICGLCGITSLAGIILMIVARVKYPKSTFAKVLMWIYIVILILGIILFAWMVMTCLEELSHCS